MAEDFDGVANRRQRISELVSEHCQEVVFPPVGFLQGGGMPLTLSEQPSILQGGCLQFISLLRNFLPLTEEFDEDLDLAADNVRLDWLLQKVDGARLVATELPA